MKNVLLIAAVAVLTLTSCEKRFDQLDNEIVTLKANNNGQNIAIANLQAQLDALTTTVNAEIARVEEIIAAVDAENDANLIEGLSAASAELSDAVALLAQADTDNLVAALAAVASAEETLVAVIADNLAATQAALASLGSTDADLLAQIGDVLDAIATLDADLSQADLDLNQAITDASNLLAAADALIQTQVTSNTLNIAELNGLVDALETAVAVGDSTSVATAQAALDGYIATVPNFVDTQVELFIQAGFSEVASSTLDQEYGDGGYSRFFQHKSGGGGNRVVRLNGEGYFYAYKDGKQVGYSSKVFVIIMNYYQKAKITDEIAVAIATELGETVAFTLVTPAEGEFGFQIGDIVFYLLNGKWFFTGGDAAGYGSINAALVAAFQS